MTAAVQCPASGALVDFPVPLHIIELPCPTCGLRVHLGGTPSAPRYAIHNEPAARHPRTGRFLAHDCEIDCLEHCAGPCGTFSADPDPEPMELGGPIAAYYAGDATQRAIDEASDFVTRHEDDDYGDVDRDDYRQRVGDLRDHLRGRWDR